MSTPLMGFASEILRLEGAVALSNLDRGMRLYSPGDPSDQLFLVHSGRVKISVPGSGGKQCIFQIVRPGEVFGEGAVFGERIRRAVAEVLEPTSVTVIPREAVLAYAGENPEFWQSFAEVLGQRVRHLEEQVEWLSLLEVEQRIARLLLRWAGSAQENGSSEEPPQFRLSQKDLAGLVGATRETTSSSLNKLQRRGCLEIRRRCLVINSLDRLALRVGAEVDPRSESPPDPESESVTEAGEMRSRGHASGQ